MIRAILREKGRSYPWEIFKELRARIIVMGHHPPSYQSVRKLMFVLRKLELIIPVGEPESQFAKHYYGLALGREEDPAWRNPYDALYHPEEFRRMTVFRRRERPIEWMAKMRRELGKRG